MLWIEILFNKDRVIITRTSCITGKVVCPKTYLFNLTYLSICA